VYDRGNSEFSDRSERCQGGCRDHNANRPDSHPTNGVDVMKAELSQREQNKVSRCLTERLSGKPQRTTNLKLPVHGGPR
jgi:hypothetical protein